MDSKVCLCVLQQRGMTEYKKYQRKIYPQLFEHAMIVGLRLSAGSTHTYEPHVIYKFPEIVSMPEERQMIQVLKTEYIFTHC